jgi:hypothetical protein
VLDLEPDKVAIQEEHIRHVRSIRTDRVVVLHCCGLVERAIATGTASAVEVSLNGRARPERIVERILQPAVGLDRSSPFGLEAER